MRLSTLRNLIRELKHQTFLIHEQHGSPRRTGSVTRFTRQMQIIKENNLTWNNHERRQNNSFEMSFKDLREVFFLSYEENIISDEEFLLLFDEYSSKNREFEPLVSTWVLAFWSRSPQFKKTSWHAQWLSYQERNVWWFSSLFFVYRAHKKCSFDLQNKFGRHVEFLNQSCR